MTPNAAMQKFVSLDIEAVWETELCERILRPCTPWYCSDQMGKKKGKLCFTEITYGGFSRTVRESAAMLSYQFHELCALIHRAGGESKCRRGGGQI